MACFLCHQHGHWSRACPMATCRFCGENGHSTQACPLSYMRTDIEDAKNFEDLFFACHMYVPNIFEMKKKVDTLVKPFCKSGMVDPVDVVVHIARCGVNPDDDGHLKVLGYIIAKYVDVYTHPLVKSFINQVHGNKVYNLLGLITCYKKNGEVYYRKRTGFVV